MRVPGSTVNASALTADGCFAELAAASISRDALGVTVMSVPGDDQLHRGMFTPDMMVRALKRAVDRTVIQLPDGTTISAAAFRAATSRYCQALRSQGLPVGARI